MRYGGELGEYMKKHNVKPFGQMIMPLCQVIFFLVGQAKEVMFCCFYINGFFNFCFYIMLIFYAGKTMKVSTFGDKGKRFLDGSGSKAKLST